MRPYVGGGGSGRRKSGVCWDVGEGEGCAESGRDSEGRAGRQGPCDSRRWAAWRPAPLRALGQALKGESPWLTWVFRGERTISDAQSIPTTA